MNMNFAKCARCKGLFNRVRGPVCHACQEEEERDYNRIRDALYHNPGMNVEEAAEAADVDVECVLRMLGMGLLNAEGLNDSVRCGQCGAPAMSVTKKLCEKCLGKMNRDFARAMDDLKRRVGERMVSVHRTVEQKRR